MRSIEKTAMLVTTVVVVLMFGLISCLVRWAQAEKEAKNEARQALVVAVQDAKNLGDKLRDTEAALHDVREAIKLQNAYLDSARQRAEEWLQQRNEERELRKKIGIWLPLPYAVKDHSDLPPPHDKPFPADWQVYGELRHGKNGFWEVRWLQGVPEA